MAIVPTYIEILDSNLGFITRVNTPVPLSGGNLVEYSQELSDYGQCRFRVSNYHQLFVQFGDILKPHAFHVRLNRGGVYVWQGAIIENSHRNKDFTEVIAATYEWYLSKKLVHRSSLNPTTNVADGIYRIFNSGTMQAAVTAIMTETIADWQSSNHALAGMTLGTIDNPNYPLNLTDGNTPPNRLTGPWSFGNGIAAPQLTFDFHTLLYILKSFGAYTYADFTVDNTRAFQFRRFLGSDRRGNVALIWGQHGNAVDFNLPRFGQRQVNSIFGIATDSNGTILHSAQSDQASIAVSGLLEGIGAYIDIKDQATLNARIQAELPLVSSIEEGATTMTLDENGYAPGVFNIGDIVDWQVTHTAVQYQQPRRIVGISVTVHNTGREMTTVQGNALLPFQPNF